MNENYPWGVQENPERLAQLLAIESEAIALVRHLHESGGSVRDNQVLERLWLLLSVQCAACSDVHDSFAPVRHLKPACYRCDCTACLDDRLK